MIIEVSKRIYNGKYNIGSIIKDISTIEVVPGGIKNVKQVHVYGGKELGNRII